MGVEENLDEDNLGEDKVEASVGESDSEMIEEGVPNVSPPPLNMGLTKNLVGEKNNTSISQRLNL